MVNKNRRDIKVFSDVGGSAAVSSQMHSFNSYKSHHTKGEPWDYPMKFFFHFSKTNESTLPPLPLIKFRLVCIRTNTGYCLNLIWNYRPMIILWKHTCIFKNQSCLGRYLMFFFFEIGLISFTTNCIQPDILHFTLTYVSGKLRDKTLNSIIGIDLYSEFLVNLE